MKKWCALLLVLFPLLSFAETTQSFASQKRLPEESFQQALKRIQNHLPKEIQNTLIKNESPVGNKKHINDMDFSKVPELASQQQLMDMFYLIRDTRYLYTLENPDFARRISWLYPDDGCFARAALAGMKLNNAEFPRPAKIFAFGELMFKTSYSNYGYVSWWYHVAPVVAYMGAYYVLDPAINSEGPMLVNEWYRTMGSLTDVEGVVCNPYAYQPFDNCMKADKESDKHAANHESFYLEQEWDRMSALGFNPAVILGENPPWI